MQHHTLFTATVLSLSESYSQCTGKAGIDTVLSNDKAVAFFSFGNAVRPPQDMSSVVSTELYTEYVCTFLIIRVTIYSQFTCAFSGHITSIKPKTEIHTTLEFS